jgi:hypothetical protein
LDLASDTNSTKPGTPIAVRPWPWVVSLVCVLVALVFFGRNLDFSAYAHPDEPGKIAQIVEGRHNFNHPLLMLNSVRFLTGALGKSQDAEFVKLAGRWSSVVFSSLAVGLLVLVAGRLHGRFVAAAAGVFLITNPMLFQLSHFFKEDPALLFGLSLTLVAMLVFSSSKSAPAAVFLGVASACTVSGKYAGALIIPFSIYIIFACSENRRRDLAAMLLACGVAFGLINLPLLAAPIGGYRSLKREVALLAGVHSHEFLNVEPYWIYGRYYLESATAALTVLMLAYGYTIFKRGFRLNPVECVIIVWPLVYVGVLTFQTRPFERYLLPASCLFACLSAFGLGSLFALPAGRILAALAVVAAIIPQAPRLYRIEREFIQDRQAEVAQFLESHLPSGSVLMADSRVYLPPLNGRSVVRRALSDNDTIEGLIALGFTHVAVTSRKYAQFFAKTPRNKTLDIGHLENVRASYERLFQDGILVKEWKSEDKNGRNRFLRIYSIENARSSTKNSMAFPNSSPSP